MFVGLSPLELDFPAVRHLALGTAATGHPSSHFDFPLNGSPFCHLPKCFHYPNEPHPERRAPPFLSRWWFCLGSLPLVGSSQSHPVGVDTMQLVPGSVVYTVWFFPQVFSSITSLPCLALLFPDCSSHSFGLSKTNTIGGALVGGGRTGCTWGHFHHSSSARRYLKSWPFMSTALLKSIA